MKYFVFFLTLSFIIACNNDKKKEETLDAQEYNDLMISLQKKVDRSLVNLISAIDSHDSERMEKAHKKAKEISDSAISELEEIDGSFDNGVYKAEMTNLLEVYHSVIRNELYSIINIYNLPDEEYTETHKAEVSDYFDEALKQYSIALANFADFQKRFADYHGLRLEKN